MGAVAAIGAAQRWGLRPSAMWIEDGEWTHRDRLLAMAYEIYERSIDRECGHSRLLAGDGEYDGHYHVKTWTCLACKAREQDDESRENRKYKPRPGEKRSIWMKLFNPNRPDGD